MGRSRAGRRAAGVPPAAPRAASPPSVDVGGATTQASAPTVAAATTPRVWQGLAYRPLPDADAARPLFDFAAVPWPGAAAIALAWGAFEPVPAGERVVGAGLVERAGTAALLHGPLISTADEERRHAPLEVAGQLLAAVIDHATAVGVRTLYARPQGLDRVWIRHGFLPVPEVALPAALAGRPGAGLYAWRGGSALWTLREAAEG